ncbi:MAG TPA: carboxyl transferase domain-containing protein [Deltaproteobacteria bacterium]|nr:carboxyl transferase domain-containing protein [Deltaproteobacteria bacterium]HPJ94306.1 carboxyl transferase domain-containing protein [Deltaproteobacteria bacterium]HPR51786.1 carboxyl transferase domain-containing protein [Deltaproteobacteria bacterium]
MDVIESKIDTSSEEYRKNYESMEALVSDLKEQLRIAREERSEKAKARIAAQGKLPTLKKLELLLDRNTPFLELAPLAARGMYDGKVHAAGLIAGIGVVEGREVLVCVGDPTIKGGAVYPMGVKKNLRLQTICMENRLPMINLLDSAGAFLPLQSEIFPDVDDGGRIFYNQAIISKMGIPQITAVMGLCTAGGAYVPAMSEEVVHVKGTGAIFLGGPPLVKAATGEEVTADQLGGAEVHCIESGVSDHFAEDDAHAISIVRKIVKNLPKNEKARLSVRKPVPPLYDPKELYGVVSRELRTPYDVRELIARLVDGSEFLEFKELYGPTLVTGFAYIHGYPVGILGNNGILFSNSSLKATQFIQLCDRRKIPLLFLQNINGYIVGREYERLGITKDGHKMVNAVSTATVPKFTVIVGASFGAGNYGMCGRAYSPRFLWMWPNAQIGVMGGEQAADVLVTLKNDQNAKAGLPPMTQEEVDFIRQPIIDAARKEGDAYYSTSNIWDDGILDPAQTRDVLGLAISASLNAPIRDDVLGYGIFRM